MTNRIIFGSGEDSIPDPFTFTDITGINPSTVTTSGTVTVTGLSPNISINITASGGTVDAGTTTLSGTFASSKAVTTSSTGTFVMAARVTTSASFSTAVNCTVTINGVSDIFTVTTRVADTTPNSFNITDITPAELNTLYSSSVVPSGYDYASWSVTNGAQASTDNATWTTSGNINSGQTLYVRLTSSSSFVTTVNTLVTIGGVGAVWAVITRQADTTGTMTFTDVNSAELSTVTTSTTVTATGFEPNYTFTITASGGMIDVGTTALSGTFASSKSVTTSSTGTFVIAARATSSSNYSTAVNCVVTAGNTSDTFTVTTRAIDTTPVAFAFTDLSNAELSTTYTTGVVPTGYDSASWTVTGGTGSVDNVTFATSGTITAGQTFYVRGTSSASFSTAVNVTATIGGISDVYTITTRAADLTPVAFSFTDVTGASLSTVYTSNTVTVTGLEPNYSINISASGGTVDAGTSSLSGTFAASKTVTTSASGTLVVAARVTSSASYSTAINCTITIGTGSDIYTVTTQAIDTTPNQFIFTDVTAASRSTDYTSNTVTVTGLSPGISVTISASGGTVDAGTSSLSGTFAASKTVTTSASGTLVVAARVTSSASYSTAINCTITIGGVADTYTVTTGSPIGEAVFTSSVFNSSGTSTWTCPTGVTSVCAICVGAGRGSGGGVGWKNNIVVIPGTVYTLYAPSNALGTYDVAFISNTTVRGGNGTATTGGTYTGDGGGAGGAYGDTYNSQYSGGGGAGGYTGAGGAGGAGGQYGGVSGTAGTGGGGGGGGGSRINGGGSSVGGGGGGVGLFGQGTNGAGGYGGFNGANYPGGGGGGGSGGGNGGAVTWYTTGGLYGGGNGGFVEPKPLTNYAIRVIWGSGRSFPSNAT